MSGRSDDYRGGVPSTLIKRVVDGYRNLFDLLAGILPLLGGILLLSVALVLPLWYLATNHRPLYTALVLIVVGAGAIFLVLRRFLRQPGKRRLLGRGFLLLLTLISILGAVRAIALGSVLGAVIGLPIAILLTGFAAAPKKRV